VPEVCVPEVHVDAIRRLAAELCVIEDVEVFESQFQASRAFLSEGNGFVERPVGVVPCENVYSRWTLVPLMGPSY